MTTQHFSFAFITAVIAMLSMTAHADLTIYTDRPQDRFTKAAAEFTRLTGQKVILVEASYKELLAKHETEGTSSPADLIITKDLVNLSDLKTKGLLQSLPLTPAMETVAPAMRDADRSWVAISFRARTAAYDPSRVAESELGTYEDLADSKWQGRLCLRTSSGGYNEALVASLIVQHGVTKAKTIVAGWVANLAAPVFPNDTSLLEAIAKGVCDVGIVNHYYLAQVVAQNPNFPVKVSYLGQTTDGVHTNGTGVGFLRTSQQASLAQTFVDIMLSESVQLEFSAAHFDFPAVQSLSASTFIKDWGVFKMNPVPWTEIGMHVPTAKALMSEVGYK